MTDQKSDGPKGASNQNKGSGSDTASAAKISAGTSVGNVGQSPMPHAQPGTSQAGAGQAGAGQSGAGQSGAGQSGAGQSGAGQSSAGQSGQSGQSPSTASHTSKPMGGQAGSTGAGRNPAGQPSQGQSGQGHTGQGQSGQSSQGKAQGGVADTARNAAGQAQEKAGEIYEQASEWAEDAYERASSWASDTFERGSEQFDDLRSRSGQHFGGTGRGVQRYVAENPVMVGLVGLAAGLLLGALLPRTRREDAAFGEWADEVRGQGLRYAQEATQRGREFVDEAFTGDDPRFGKHESEFRPSEGPGGANRH